MTIHHTETSVRHLGERKVVEIFSSAISAPYLSVSLRIRLDPGAPARIACAFATQVQPTIAVSDLSLLETVVTESLREIDTHLSSGAERTATREAVLIDWEIERRRVEARWLNSPWTGKEVALLKTDSRAAPVAIGFAVPATEIGSKEYIGYWPDANGTWSPGKSVSASEGGDNLSSKLNLSTHAAISIMQGGVLASREAFPTPARYASSKVRPLAIFKEGFCLCTASRRIFGPNGLAGYVQAIGGRVQHMSMGYDGTGPGLTIFEESDRIRIAMIRGRTFKPTNTNELEASIAAWVERLASLDLELWALKEPQKSIVKASHSRLDTIEQRIGPLPHTDKTFLLALLGRGYSALERQCGSIGA